MYKPEYALFNEGVSRFPVTFFSVSNLHKLPVKMAVVENKRAREIVQSADYFIFPDNSQSALSAVKGNVFSGFRVLEHRQPLNKPPVKDWVSFLGASYFRAVGIIVDRQDVVHLVAGVQLAGAGHVLGDEEKPVAVVGGLAGRGLPARNQRASMVPVAEYAQQEPHEPWFLTGVTAPLVRQSKT